MCPASAEFVCGPSTIIRAQQGDACKDASTPTAMSSNPTPARQVPKGLGPRKIKSEGNYGEGLMHQL